MDKYELSIKEDKIRKHAENRDYETAAKIADTIDWKRVRNIKMLTLVSQIYEKLGNYDAAKRVLLEAYERVPVGRRMLYKLTELSVKAGQLKEAAEFFEEFQEIAPNDISKLILAYQIDSAKGEPLEKLITILELYRKNEFEEKWAYELAYLYHKAGKEQECVRLCNEIILWFSVGHYVDKAMQLKMKYEPLTAAEQDKMDNKEKFEERIKAVEREFAAQEELKALLPPKEEEVPEEPSEEEELSFMQEELAQAVSEAAEQIAADEAQIQASEISQEIPVPEIIIPESFFETAPEAPVDAPAETSMEPPAEEPAEDDGLSVTEEFASAGNDLATTQEFVRQVQAALAEAGIVQTEEAPAQAAAPEIPVPEIPEAPAAEAPLEPVIEEPDMAKMQIGLESNDIGQTREFLDEVTAALAASASVFTESVPTEEEAVKEAPVPESPAEEAPASMEQEEPSGSISCVVVEEEDNEQRIAIAVEKLKKTHEILETPATKVAKISGGKLNEKGVASTIAKLAGRDLIVDYAADLSKEAAADLAAVIRSSQEVMVILLVDTAERINDFLLDNPELDSHCLYLTDDEEDYEDIPPVEPVRESYEEEDPRMTVEEFVACAHEFAEEEECVFDAGGEEALKGLAERLRASGAPMDESSVRNVLDEVIDKAEHRGLKGLFDKKYDKQGFLILKGSFFEDL